MFPITIPTLVTEEVYQRFAWSVFLRGKRFLLNLFILIGILALYLTFLPENLRRFSFFIVLFTSLIIFPVMYFGTDFQIKKAYQKTPYHQPNVLATIVASNDALAYMNYTFPNLKTYKMTLGIDTTVFSYADKKQKQICFMPRKLTDDVRQVILILKLRGKLKDWKLVPIDNKTEQEVAEIMKQSTFFLSFNHREGFGLPPVEAMACGCYVVGYHGQGGKEYFKPEFSSLKSPETILEKGKKASEYIFSHYAMAKEEEDTIKIWNDILNR